jgi:transcriptional regulator with XRE-family HTH domain
VNVNKLKEYRQINNLTQEQMAKRLGIAHSGYVCIEKGYREPSLSVLKRMAEITGYSAESLIYETEEDEKTAREDELNAYKLITFKLIKTHCVQPGASKLSKSESEINDIVLSKINYMLTNISGKMKKEYETAVKNRG